MPGEPINLINNPVEDDFEDYIAAFLQASGLYVEKSIIYRGKEELLELDIITSNYTKESVQKHLVEIKSKNWGFSDVFKVKGWMVYLGLGNGLFIIKKPRNNTDFYQEKADELNIKLIDNSDLAKTSENLNDYFVREPKMPDVGTIRFSYMLERRISKHIKLFKKRYPNITSYRHLDDYFFTITSGSFFTSSPTERIKKLFESYVKYKNITAKICHEINNGEYNNQVTTLNSDCFNRIFYNSEYHILQCSIYVEYMARITILKTCIQYIIQHYKGDLSELDLNEIFCAY